MINIEFLANASEVSVKYKKFISLSFSTLQ